MNILAMCETEISSIHVLLIRHVYSPWLVGDVELTFESFVHKSYLFPNVLTLYGQHETAI